MGRVTYAVSHNCLLFCCGPRNQSSSPSPPPCCAPPPTPPRAGNAESYRGLASEVDALAGAGRARIRGFGCVAIGSVCMSACKRGGDPTSQSSAGMVHLGIGRSTSTKGQLGLGFWSAPTIALDRWLISGSALVAQGIETHALPPVRLHVSVIENGNRIHACLGARDEKVNGYKGRQIMLDTRTEH